MIDQRVSNEFGVGVLDLDERTRKTGAGIDQPFVYMLKDAWSVTNGQWPGALTGDEWAKEEYYDPALSGAGRIYARVIEFGSEVEVTGGTPVSTDIISAWAGLYDLLFAPLPNLRRIPVKGNGWGDIAIAPGETWNVKPAGWAEGVVGLSLPIDPGTSYYLVWAKVPTPFYLAWLAGEDVEIPRKLEDRLDLMAKEYQTIIPNPQAALFRAIVGHGMIPLSDEFEFVQGRASVRAQYAYEMATGKRRIYYVIDQDWRNVQTLTVGG